MSLGSCIFFVARLYVLILPVYNASLFVFQCLWRLFVKASPGHFDTSLGYCLFSLHQHSAHMTFVNSAVCRLFYVSHFLIRLCSLVCLKLEGDCVY